VQLVFLQLVFLASTLSLQGFSGRSRLVRNLAALFLIEGAYAGLQLSVQVVRVRELI